MTGADGAARGWPFLIARGRRAGYTVLLAPGFLIDDNDYGFLEDVAGPVPRSEPCRVVTAASPRGRRLCLVWSDHQVTESDLADGLPALDEHSRPLRLLAGFVSDAPTSEPSEVDLAASRHAALQTYRRFLADEEHFATERSTPFELHSAVVPSPRQREPQPPPRPTRRRTVPVAVAGIAIAGLIAVAAVLSFSSSNSEPPPPPCPTTTTTQTTPPVSETTGAALPAASADPASSC